MFLSFLTQGPIWAEIGASVIGKTIVAGALSAASNPDKVKAVYNTFVNSASTEDEKATEVINIFKDVDK